MRLRAAAGVLAAAALLVAPAGPALAHDAVVRTSPAAGAWLPARPGQVRLTFVQPPVELGAAMAVTGPDGARVLAGAARVEGADLVGELTAAGGGSPAEGAYTVVWRVTSADGHPLSGRFSGGVGTPSSALPQPEGASAPPGAGGGGGVVAWALAGTAVVVAAGLALLRLALRRRTPAA
ncbi:MAG: copper resistance protein CopC [Kineosporiaceae bacterium]